MNPWICVLCTYKNSHSGPCKVCNQGQCPTPVGKWRCTYCTVMNDSNRVYCWVCNYRNSQSVDSENPKVSESSLIGNIKENLNWKNPLKTQRQSCEEDPESRKHKEGGLGTGIDFTTHKRQAQQQIVPAIFQEKKDNFESTIESKPKQLEDRKRPPNFLRKPSGDTIQKKDSLLRPDKYSGEIRPLLNNNSNILLPSLPVEMNPSSWNKTYLDPNGNEMKHDNYFSERHGASASCAPSSPRASLSQDIADNMSFHKPPASLDMDDGTRELIRKMMQEDICMLCHDRQGWEIGGGCDHKVCESCGKRKLLEGIANKKWTKHAVTCPIDNCENNLPSSTIQHFALGKALLEKLETMQQTFNMSKTEGLVTCPAERCGFIFVGEAGKVVKGQIEKGRNNRPLSNIALAHKAKHRFRCPQCNCNFCGNCSEFPYHLGDTCETFKEWKESKKCRFCHATIDPRKIRHKPNRKFPGWNNVCHLEECQTRRSQSCGKVNSCGHFCIGIRNEKQCPPCFHPDCVSNGYSTHEDFCSICWTEEWAAAPCVQLNCKHVIHYHCLMQKLEKRWPAARVVFNYMTCGECKQPIKHPELRKSLYQHESLKSHVEKMAIKQLKREGLGNDKRLHEKGGKYYNNMELFAMDRLAYYICFKCKKPYYGGMRKCDAQDIDKFNKEHLVCGGCRMGPNMKACKIHGTEFIMWKCRFCCGRASWFCWGNTHFCDNCHTRQEGGDYLNRKPMSAHPKCPGIESGNPENCPLKIKHPPNGENFCLGCNVCLLS